MTDEEIASIKAEVITNFDVLPEEVSTTGTQLFDQIPFLNVEPYIPLLVLL